MSDNPYQPSQLVAEPAVPTTATRWWRWALKLVVLSGCAFVTFFLFSTCSGGLAHYFSGYADRDINRNPWYWSGILPGTVVAFAMLRQAWRSAYWPLWGFGSVLAGIAYAFVLYLVFGRI